MEPFESRCEAVACMVGISHVAAFVILAALYNTAPFWDGVPLKTVIEVVAVFTACGAIIGALSPIKRAHGGRHEKDPH